MAIKITVKHVALIGFVVVAVGAIATSVLLSKAPTVETKCAEARERRNYMDATNTGQVGGLRSALIVFVEDCERAGR